MSFRTTLTWAAAFAAAPGIAACSFDGRGLLAAGDDDPADARVADAEPDPDAAEAPIDAPPAVDASVPDPAGTLRAAFTSQGVVLDGFADEWPTDGWATFDMAEAANYDQNNPTYQPSAQAHFAALHDGAYLYLFIEVTDDALRSDSTELWNDDSVDIYLDAEDDGAGSYGADDQWVIVRNDATFGDYPVDDINLEGFVRTAGDGGGYAMELRIDKWSLSAGALGAELGFDLAINDDDGHGGADYDGDGLWYAASAPVCPQCCTSGSSEAWCDTSLFGRLLLEP